MAEKNMPSKSVSRRDVLKSLGMGAIAGGVLSTIPARAAEYAHHMVMSEKAAAAGGAYTPKYFSAHQYKTLQSLCQTIFPADGDSGGAIEAGAPEFIDLISSENSAYQLKLGGGLMWTDETCIDRYGKTYLDCPPQQQKEIIDLIAYRNNAKADPSLSPGIEFFSFLRNMTADGFFTSKIGIEYLGYVGNAFLTEFKGCPPVPGL
jgi:hypothetical protein